MNYISTSTKRLLQFAQHLAVLQNHPKQNKYIVVTLYTKVEDSFLDYEIQIPAYITEELSKVFPDYWRFNEGRKEYTLIGIPVHVTAEAGIGSFFRLTQGEFLHAFSIAGGYQGYHYPHIFGGAPLNEESTPSDIAKNLYDLAAYRISQNNMPEN